MSEDQQPLEKIEQSLKRAAATLKEAHVPFLVGGSLAWWARGGPEPRGDLDLVVKQEDAERALKALVEAGMRPERPPEGWLLKAWDGDVLIDLIFHPIELPVTDEVMARGEELNVFSIKMPVMALEHVISTKLLSLNEHYLDYEALLGVARAVRERVDWAEVRSRTESSPYARAFFALLAELEIVTPETWSEPAEKKVRVLPASRPAQGSGS